MYDSLWLHCDAEAVPSSVFRFWRAWLLGCGHLCGQAGEVWFVGITLEAAGATWWCILLFDWFHLFFAFTQTASLQEWKTWYRLLLLNSSFKLDILTLDKTMHPLHPFTRRLHKLSSLMIFEIHLQQTDDIPRVVLVHHWDAPAPSEEPQPPLPPSVAPRPTCHGCPSGFWSAHNWSCARFCSSSSYRYEVTLKWQE